MMLKLKTMSASGQLGGNKKRRPSLRDRRLPSLEKLTLSVTNKSKSQKHPLKQLREGAYDIHTDHLSTASTIDDNIEQLINSYLDK